MATGLPTFKLARSFDAFALLTRFSTLSLKWALSQDAT